MLLAAAGPPISGGRGQKDEKLGASPAAATARGAGIPSPGGGGGGSGPATPAASAPHRPMELPPSMSADAEQGRRICTSIPAANEYLSESPCSDSVDAQPNISHNHTSEAEKPKVADASASAPAPSPADGAARPAREDKVMSLYLNARTHAHACWCSLEVILCGAFCSPQHRAARGRSCLRCPWAGLEASRQVTSTSARARERPAHQCRGYTCASLHIDRDRRYRTDRRALPNALGANARGRIPSGIRWHVDVDGCRRQGGGRVAGE
jgi:hypothetical protein